MNNELQKILTKLRELQPYIVQKYHIDSIEVFGSYVRDEQTIKSDLDLLVAFTTIPSLLKYIELKNYLSDNLGINVDLVMKDALKPGISQFILRESISL